MKRCYSAMRCIRRTRWARLAAGRRKDTPVAAAQTRGRQRLNVHDGFELETGQTRMLEALTVGAASTIMLPTAMLPMAIEVMYPGKRLIHLFLDNARCHHAKLVQAWLPSRVAGSSFTSSPHTVLTLTRSNGSEG